MTSAIDHMTTVERMAHKLHRAHEQRAVRRHPFHTPRPWDDLSYLERREFTQVATHIYLTDGMPIGERVDALCEHYDFNPADNAARAYFRARIDEAS